MANSSDKSTFELLLRLWHQILPRRRRQYILLLMLMVATSFAEVVSIGSVLPFLGVLTSPERIFDHPVTRPILPHFAITEPAQLMLPIAVAFGVFALVAGSMRLLLVWASTRIAFATGADLSINIYRRTLYQPYAVHCARNSSEIIAGISGKANGVIYSTIYPILMLISSSILLVTVLVAMLVINSGLSLAVFGSFGLIYLFIVRITRDRLSLNSERIADESTTVIKILQEGLGGIRDVLIDGNQEAYCSIYRRSDLELRSAQANNSFISNSPRPAVEALGLMFIAALAYMLSQRPGGFGEFIPVFGALALGAQRLLPALQQAYGSWTQIKGGHSSLYDALELLEQPLPNHATLPTTSLPFKHSICLEHLEFRYGPDAKNVLEEVNLIIPKGGRVGFIGSSGSGKSTLLDLVMGLLEPTSGAIKVDGNALKHETNRAWQAHIAHVPQAIFLADSTIEENIAFGVPRNKIDHMRVKQAAKQARIEENILSWPDQYQTFVGERGIRLSGGQRQRIGIARALYKQADVIIFDEATSALDNETEEAVMNAIENLSKDLTLLIIAHRLTTLKNCTLIVELGDGGIKRSGSYEEILNRRSEL